MNFYETVYVVHPALQAGRLDDIIQNIEEKVKNLKGKHLYFENWGKKKLAYAIDKQKYGTYVLMQFSIDPIQIRELTSELEHNSNVLRFLISKIEEEDVLKEKPKTSESDNENKNKETEKSDEKVVNDDTKEDAVSEEDKSETENSEE